VEAGHPGGRIRVTHPDDLDQLRRLLAPTLKAAERVLTRGPECLGDVTLASLADGSLEAAARASAVSHLAVCPHCRAAVASVARLLADPAVRSAVPDSLDQPWRRFARVAVPLAAAAMLLVVFALPRRGEDVAPPHRGTPTTATTPMLVSPVGIVAEGNVLQWTTVPGADRYRLTLFDAQSRIVFSEETADTLVVLPDSTLLEPGRQYLWMVEARTGWDRWSASAPVTFSVAPDGVR
jgi:anti-sigma factor RsiW